MKMNLKALCRAFHKAPEEETVSTRNCNPYLLEQVARPLMRGESLRLRDVDCEQFESDDIRWLAGYCDSLSMQSRKLEQVVGAVASIEPAACKARRYC